MKPSLTHKPHRAGQAGVTLLEVMITLIIISVGLLGLAALQATALRNNHSAYLRTQATVLSQEILDHVRANRSRLPESAEIPDRAFWDQRVAQILPNGTISEFTADVANDTFDITLSIRWTDERFDEGDPDDPDDPPPNPSDIEFVTRTRI